VIPHPDLRYEAVRAGADEARFRGPARAEPARRPRRRAGVRALEAAVAALLRIPAPGEAAPGC
jgi:hypothetical protein